MNSRQRDDLLVITPTPKKYQVVFDDGSKWTGTRRELFAENPDWWQFAKEIPQVTNPVLPEEMDYANDPRSSRLPNSSRRYYMPDARGDTTYEAQPEILQSPIKARRSAQHVTKENIPATRSGPRRRIHWLTFVGVGAIVALLLWVGGNWVGYWWSGVQDDWKYTSTFRTFSIDQAVGHNNDSNAHPSHFIVQNDKRHILIIELPADDMTKTIIYQAPTLIGDGQEKLPVTISFETDPQTGRLDMVLHVEDQSYTYTNNGTKFVQPTV